MFLTVIAQNGRIAVPHPQHDPADLPALLEQDVVTHEAAHRLELARPVPAFNIPAAVWANTQLYRCCQFLVYRDVPGDVLRDTLAQPSPSPLDAGVCYSVDVAFAYLPDVYRLARGIAPDDPLLLALRQLAQAWPLSSVGIPANLGELNIAPFIEDPCLRELYVTRVVQRQDTSRLHPPSVRAAVRATLGAFPELSPAIVNALAKEQSP